MQRRPGLLPLAILAAGIGINSIAAAMSLRSASVIGNSRRRHRATL